MKNKLLAKAGAVLDVLCAASGAVSLKELAEKLNMPLPTLSRLCNDMVEMQWLEKSDYHHFVPGVAMLRFGSRVEQLSPYATAAMPLMREYSLRSGLNGILFGYSREVFFRICSCAQKYSDHNVFRRSGAFLALMYICDVAMDDCRQVIERIFPDFSGVEINMIEREYYELQKQHLLLRINSMRQWYITVPFLRENGGYALTFYGQGPEKVKVETVCAEVSAVADQIRSAWGRLQDK